MQSGMGVAHSHSTGLLLTGSGRGGRRFKPCHSDQETEQFEHPPGFRPHGGRYRSRRGDLRGRRELQ